VLDQAKVDDIAAAIALIADDEASEQPTDR
jgi:hypothetical protein